MIFERFYGWGAIQVSEDGSRFANSAILDRIVGIAILGGVTLVIRSLRFNANSQSKVVELAASGELALEAGIGSGIPCDRPALFREDYGIRKRSIDCFVPNQNSVKMIHFMLNDPGIAIGEGLASAAILQRDPRFLQIVTGDRDVRSSFDRIAESGYRSATFGTADRLSRHACDYRFLIKMYEPPSGCLVEPVGYGYLEFSTQDFQIVDGRIDLGTIDINLQPFPKLGDPLPDFRYQDGDGKTHTISEFRGKRVMIDFWASWCQPCLKAFPDLKKIHQRTNSRDDVAMISISVDEDRAAAKTVALRHDLSWAVGYAGKSPNEGNSAKVLGISTVPTYLVIGEDGDLLYRGFSFKEAEEILTGK